MKVLHIITRMNTGGPAVFLDHLTTSLANLGVKVRSLMDIVNQMKLII